VSEIEKRRTMLELARSASGGRGFLTAARERELVEKGVLGLGLAPFEAAGLIAAGADAHGIALETHLERTLDKLVETAAGKRRRLRRDRFRELVAYAQSLSNGALGTAKAEDKVKRAAERCGVVPHAAGLLRSTRWYRRSGASRAEPDDA
jgi:hypothetical protein